MGRMRHVLALFDAPVPARAALLALAEAGFAPDDLTCAAAAGVPGAAGLAAATVPAEEDALERRLRSLGLSEDDAATCAEGVARRGAILIVASGPTLSAEAARRAIEGAAPPTLAEHRARWDGRAGPGLGHYGWADVPPPSG